MCAAKKAKKKEERERKKKEEKGREKKKKAEKHTKVRARARLRDTVGDLKMISTVGQSEGSLAQRKPEMKMEMPTAMTMQIAQGRRNENEKIANARME